MIDGVNGNASLGKLGGASAAAGLTPTVTGGGGAGGASFADALTRSINEAARLQQDGSGAVQALAAGKSQDVASVAAAMEESDIAFKTLLAIRGKLMDAYEEIKAMSV